MRSYGRVTIIYLLTVYTRRIRYTQRGRRRDRHLDERKQNKKKKTRNLFRLHVYKCAFNPFYSRVEISSNLERFWKRRLSCFRIITKKKKCYVLSRSPVFKGFIREDWRNSTTRKKVFAEREKKRVDVKSLHSLLLFGIII